MGISVSCRVLGWGGDQDALGIHMLLRVRAFLRSGQPWKVMESWGFWVNEEVTFGGQKQRVLENAHILETSPIIQVVLRGSLVYSENQGI